MSRRNPRRILNPLPRVSGKRLADQDNIICHEQKRRVSVGQKQRGTGQPVVYSRASPFHVWIPIEKYGPFGRNIGDGRACKQGL